MGRQALGIAKEHVIAKAVEWVEVHINDEEFDAASAVLINAVAKYLEAKLGDEK